MVWEFAASKGALSMCVDYFSCSAGATGACGIDMPQGRTELGNALNYGGLSWFLAAKKSLSEKCPEGLWVRPQIIMEKEVLS